MIHLKYIEEWDLTIIMMSHWALEKHKFDYYQGKDIPSDREASFIGLFSPLELQVLKTFKNLKEPPREDLELLRDLALVKSVEWHKTIQFALNKGLEFPTDWVESFLLEVFSE